MAAGERKRIGILGRENAWHAQVLARAAARERVDVSFLDFATLAGELHQGVAGRGERFFSGALDLRSLDAVIVRSMPAAGLEPIVFRMDLLARLESSGVTVVNPARALEYAIDKYRSLGVLLDAGLPIPRTQVVQHADMALEAFDHLGGDVVVKPIFGGEGRGITRVTDRELARRAFHLLDRLDAVIYLQEFIPHEGHDLRLLAVGDQVWGMRRTSTDWRTNVSRGACVEPLAPDRELWNLARTASRAIGAPVVGVDVLPGRDGKHYVLEANGVPGWRGLQRVTETDIAAAVVRYVLDRASGRTGGKA